MGTRSLQALVDQWTVSAGWHKTIGPAVRALFVDRQDHKAWATLAMVFGDTRAPELCLLISLHVDSFPDPAAAKRISGHLVLAAADLGLAFTHPTDPKRRLALDERKLRAWLDDVLEPLDGDLARGAALAVGVAGARAGIVSLGQEGRPPQTLTELSDLSALALT